MVSHGGGLVFKAFYSVKLQMWSCPQLKCSHLGRRAQISSDGGHDPLEMGMGNDLSRDGEDA